MKPINSYVKILQKDLNLDDGRIISSGTHGFHITEDYLKHRPLSSDDQETLLEDSRKAESQGYLYIEFPNVGKCLSINPSDVL